MLAAMPFPPSFFTVACLFSLLLCTRKLFWEQKTLFPQLNPSQLPRDPFFLTKVPDLTVPLTYGGDTNTEVQRCRDDLVWTGKESLSKRLLWAGKVQNLTNASERKWCCSLHGIATHSCFLSQTTTTLKIVVKREAFNFVQWHNPSWGGICFFYLAKFKKDLLGDLDMFTGVPSHPLLSPCACQGCEGCRAVTGCVAPPAPVAQTPLHSGNCSWAERYFLQLATTKAQILKAITHKLPFSCSISLELLEGCLLRFHPGS